MSGNTRLFHSTNKMCIRHRSMFEWKIIRLLLSELKKKTKLSNIIHFLLCKTISILLLPKLLQHRVYLSPPANGRIARHASNQPCLTLLSLIHYLFWIFLTVGCVRHQTYTHKCTHFLSFYIHPF